VICSDCKRRLNKPTPPMALVRVEHYEQLQAELAALRRDVATRDAMMSDQATTNAALRARVADYERLLSGITENVDVQYDVWMTFCQQARARLARATESAGAVQK
jgi:regulator of RNase E activity RraB